MSEYIKREDIITTIEKWFKVIQLNPDILIDSIISIKSLDLVRCGECKWQKVNEETGFHGCNHRFALIKAEDDNFCPYGERRNDEDTK